jgi:carboxylate-amine ligase
MSYHDESGALFPAAHYALSVNSPFWVGQDGFEGYRLKVFERFPRTGIRDAFESLQTKITASCWSKLVASITQNSGLHPFFDTLEVRVCDANPVDDTGTAALYRLSSQSF